MGDKGIEGRRDSVWTMATKETPRKMLYAVQVPSCHHTASRQVVSMKSDTCSNMFALLSACGV